MFLYICVILCALITLLCVARLEWVEWIIKLPGGWGRAVSAPLLLSSFLPFPFLTHLSLPQYNFNSVVILFLRFFSIFYFSSWKSHLNLEFTVCKWWRSVLMYCRPLLSPQSWNDSQFSSGACAASELLCTPRPQAALKAKQGQRRPSHTHAQRTSQQGLLKQWALLSPWAVQNQSSTVSVGLLSVYVYDWVFSAPAPPWARSGLRLRCSFMRRNPRFYWVSYPAASFCSNSWTSPLVLPLPCCCLSHPFPSTVKPHLSV